MVPIQRKVRSVNFPGSEFGENWLRLQPRREVPWLHPLSDMETKAEPVWEPSSTTGPCKLDKRKLREFWLKDKRINFRRAILNPRPKADLTITFSNKRMRIKKARHPFPAKILHYCNAPILHSLDPLEFGPHGLPAARVSRRDTWLGVQWQHQAANEYLKEVQASTMTTVLDQGGISW